MSKTPSKPENLKNRLKSSRKIEIYPQKPSICVKNAQKITCFAIK